MTIPRPSPPAPGPTITTLESGYTHIRWNAECWAQLPPGFSDRRIEDEYIFHPSWNRERVNEWWTTHRPEIASLVRRRPEERTT